MLFWFFGRGEDMISIATRTRIDLKEKNEYLKFV